MTEPSLLSQQISVTPVAHYIKQQSAPDQQRFVFAYHITITNHSDKTVQLLRRKWQITDGNGEVTEIDGEGVVGQQPVIAPGQSYEYQSGAILKTPLGTMAGAYSFGGYDAVFDVTIPIFRLSVPHILN